MSDNSDEELYSLEGFDMGGVGRPFSEQLNEVEQHILERIGNVENFKGEIESLVQHYFALGRQIEEQRERSREHLARAEEFEDHFNAARNFNTTVSGVLGRVARMEKQYDRSVKVALDWAKTQWKDKNFWKRLVGVRDGQANELRRQLKEAKERLPSLEGDIAQLQGENAGLTAAINCAASFLGFAFAEYQIVLEQNEGLRNQLEERDTMPQIPPITSVPEQPIPRYGGGCSCIGPCVCIQANKQKQSNPQTNTQKNDQSNPQTNTQTQNCNPVFIIPPAAQNPQANDLVDYLRKIEQKLGEQNPHSPGREEQLQREIDSLRDRLGRAQAEAAEGKTVQTLYDRVQRRLNEAESQLDSLRRENGTLSRDVGKAQGELEGQKALYRAAEQQLERGRDEHRRLSGKISEVEAKQASERSRLEDDIRRHQDEAREKERLYRRAEEDLREAKRDISTAQRERDDIRARAQWLYDQGRLVASDRDRFKQQYDQANTAAKEAEQRAEQAESKLRELREQALAVQEERDQWETQYRTEEQQRKAAVEQRDRFCREKGELEGELATVKEENERRSNTLSEQAEAMGRLNEQIIQLTEINEGHTAELQDLREQRHLRIDYLRKKERELVDVSADLAQAQTDLEASRDAAEQLAEQVSQGPEYLRRIYAAFKANPLDETNPIHSIDKELRKRIAYLIENDQLPEADIVAQVIRKRCVVDNEALARRVQELQARREDLERRFSSTESGVATDKLAIYEAALPTGRMDGVELRRYLGELRAAHSDRTELSYQVEALRGQIIEGGRRILDLEGQLRAAGSDEGLRRELHEARDAFEQQQEIHAGFIYEAADALGVIIEDRDEGYTVEGLLGVIVDRMEDRLVHLYTRTEQIAGQLGVDISGLCSYHDVLDAIYDAGRASKASVKVTPKKPATKITEPITESTGGEKMVSKGLGFTEEDLARIGANIDRKEKLPEPDVDAIREKLASLRRPLPEVEDEMECSYHAPLDVYAGFRPQPEDITPGRIQGWIDGRAREQAPGKNVLKGFKKTYFIPQCIRGDRKYDDHLECAGLKILDEDYSGRRTFERVWDEREDWRDRIIYEIGFLQGKRTDAFDISSLWQMSLSATPEQKNVLTQYMAHVFEYRGEKEKAVRFLDSLPLTDQRRHNIMRLRSNLTSED